MIVCIFFFFNVIETCVVGVKCTSAAGYQRQAHVRGQCTYFQLWFNKSKLVVTSIHWALVACCQCWARPCKWSPSRSCPMVLCATSDCWLENSCEGHFHCNPLQMDYRYFLFASEPVIRLPAQWCKYIFSYFWVTLLAQLLGYIVSTPNGCNYI